MADNKGGLQKVRHEMPNSDPPSSEDIVDAGLAHRQEQAKTRTLQRKERDKRVKAAHKTSSKKTKKADDDDDVADAS